MADETTPFEWRGILRIEGSDLAFEPIDFALMDGSIVMVFRAWGDNIPDVEMKPRRVELIGSDCIRVLETNCLIGWTNDGVPGLLSSVTVKLPISIMECTSDGA